MHLWKPIEMLFYGQPNLYLMNYFLDLDPEAEFCALPPCTPCRGEFVEERGATGADVIDDQQKQNEVHQENQQCEPSSRASVRGRVSRRATTDEYIKREAWPRCRRVRGGSRVCILYNCEAAEHSVKALMSALETGIISGELPQNFEGLAEDL